jgi:protein-tyrosine phosphatase
MRPQVHWIDASLAGRLAIMPRPRADDWLDDEIAGWRAEGIDLVVSLLESDETAELGLHREEELCHRQEMEFVSFPIPDRGVPTSLSKTATLVQILASKISAGRAIAIHCRAGIGRSSLLAACVLICSGTNPDRVFDLISNARGVRVPDTEGQREWVGEFREAVAI